MVSSWIYLFIALATLAIGIDTLRRKQGSLYVWKQPFGYQTGYYTGKPALISGLLLTVWGSVFSADAIRSLISDELSGLLCYTFIGGFILLGLGINIFARKYLVIDAEG